MISINLPKKTCKQENCSGHVVAFGYCNKHYRRFKRHGSPLGGRTQDGEAMKFLLSDVVEFQGESCFQWRYTRDRAGYGKVRHDGRMQGAHVLVCIAAHGPAPTPKHEVAHSCGNGREGCVNPGHLRWATRKENQADKILHGTSNRGERNRGAKLTAVDVLRIRELEGTMTRRKIAELYGVHTGTIEKIMWGQKWSWL